MAGKSKKPTKPARPKAAPRPKAPPRPPRKPPAAPAAASPPPPDPEKAAAYGRHRQAMAARSREQSAAGRDIGPIPPVENPARRAAALADLEVFLLTYFPEVFYLEFSPDHREFIRDCQACVEEGGRVARAMERGSGKTAIAERATIFAILKGIHEFVGLIGASGAASAELMDSIKTEFESNDRLAADFPEVCFPIRELEGKTQRCAGQTYQGKRTYVLWRRDAIVLPTIPGSPASGVILKVASMTGRVRGMKFTRRDGRDVRPSLVLVDDFQTERSAWSVIQCKRRLGTINGTILKLAGPGKKISCIIPCTVIRKGDAADQLLDRDKNPQFRGRRCKKLNTFPKQMDLWKKYAVLRADSLRAGGRGEQATAFYRANRAAMDEGAEVAWPQRFDPDHLSALETCMVLFFEDRASFMAECQNDPLDESLTDVDLKPGDLVGRFSGRESFVVPVWATKLTAAIDVQQNALFWLVAGWDPANFSGAVVAYGAWPPQNRRYYTKADLQETLQLALPGAGLEGQIRHGLEKLTEALLGRDWEVEGGTTLRIGRAFIDRGFATDVVDEFCRVSPHAAVIRPTKGEFIGPRSRPMSEWTKRAGEEKGFHWHLTNPSEGRRALKWIKMDSNFWKSFLVERLRQAPGDPGALTFFGRSRAEHDHELLADHLCAEQGIARTEAGRTATIWTLKPGRPDNEFLDCLYGATCAASFEGVTLAGQQAANKPERRKFASYRAWREYKFGRKA